MRTFAVGDIHGQAEKLLDLLGKVGYLKEDKLIVLGDISDGRGEARKTHSLLKTIQILEGIENKELIMGNHDEFLIRYLHNKVTDEEVAHWHENGFDVTVEEIRSLLLDKSEFERLVNFYSKMVSYVETEKFIFTHAGFNTYKGFYGSTDEERMWNRRIALASKLRNGNPLNNGKTIVIGHTPTIEFMSLAVPFIGPHVIDLDTGAGYGLPLTIMNMDTLEWWQSV